MSEHIDDRPERAAIFVAEFLVWWEQAGRAFYGWNAVHHDEGLIDFAADAVTALGGWRAARRMLKSATTGSGTPTNGHGDEATDQATERMMNLKDARVQAAARRRWRSDPFDLPSVRRSGERGIELAWRGRCPACETIWTSQYDRRDCPVCHAALTPQACLHCGHRLPLTGEQVCATCSIDVERA